MKARWLLSIILAVFVLAACAPTSKPVVVIMSPPSGSQFFEGEDIAIQSSASDAQGVVRVELVVDGNVVRVDPSPTAQGQPNFTLIQTWKATSGTHTIIVRAYNVAGVMSDPTGVSVTVSQRTAQAPAPSPTSPGVPPLPPSPTSPGVPPPPPSPTTAAPPPPPSPTTAAPPPPPASSPTSPSPGCSGTPNIVSFTATSLGGGNWVLQWGAVTNADSVEIDQGIGGVATPGSRNVTAPAIGTRTYTMTARCGANTITAQATVGILLLATPVTTIIIPLPSPTPTPTPSVSQVLKQVSISAGTSGSALAECPSGSIVTGGGFASPSSLSTEVYTQSKQGNGWQVYLYNNTSSSQLVNAYAICLSGVSGGAATTQVVNQVSVAANTTGSATATCASGVLTGGGFASQSNLSTKVYTHFKQGNGWQVYLSNKTTSSQLVNAYAICLTGAGTSSTQVLKQVSVPAGTTGFAVAECPSGTLLTGGGYASQPDPGTKVYTQSKEGNGWRVYMNNTTGSSQLLNAYAICTSF
jgi:hypothetical protein